MHVHFPDRVRNLRYLARRPGLREAVAMAALAGLAIAGSAAVGVWFAVQVLHFGH